MVIGSSDLGTDGRAAAATDQLALAAMCGVAGGMAASWIQVWLLSGRPEPPHEIWAIVGLVGAVVRVAATALAGHRLAPARARVVGGVAGVGAAAAVPTLVPVDLSGFRPVALALAWLVAVVLPITLEALYDAARSAGDSWEEAALHAGLTLAALWIVLGHWHRGTTGTPPAVTWLLLALVLLVAATIALDQHRTKGRTPR